MKTAKLLNKSGVDFVAVIIPYFQSKYNSDWTANYSRIKHLLEEFNIPYIDLHGKFENIDDPSWRIQEKDNCHPSKKGHQVIAKNIHTFLIDRLKY